MQILRIQIGFADQRPVKTNFGDSSWQLLLGSSVLADRCFFLYRFHINSMVKGWHVEIIDHSWFVQKWAIAQPDFWLIITSP